MDVHGAGVVAVLGTVGAATGAISAVIVYTICARRRRLPLFTSVGGPLNWHVSSYISLDETGRILQLTPVNSNVQIQ